MSSSPSHAEAGLPVPIPGRFRGRTIMITGAGSGIGRATALRFAAEGANVLASDYNAQAAAETVALSMAAGHEGRIVAQRGDVSIEDDNIAMVQAALEAFGRLDHAFLNAGVGGAFGPIEQTTVDEWDYPFHVLVRGVFLGFKHVVPAIRAHGQGGAIVITSSIAGLVGGAAMFLAVLGDSGSFADPDETMGVVVEESPFDELLIQDLESGDLL